MAMQPRPGFLFSLSLSVGHLHVVCLRGHDDSACKTTHTRLYTSHSNAVYPPSLPSLPLLPSLPVSPPPDKPCCQSAVLSTSQKPLRQPRSSSRQQLAPLQGSPPPPLSPPLLARLAWSSPMDPETRRCTSFNMGAKDGHQQCQTPQTGTRRLPRTTTATTTVPGPHFFGFFGFSPPSFVVRHPRERKRGGREREGGGGPCGWGGGGW